MPMESKAQNRFMHWAKAHPQESGVSAKVSGDFIAAQHGHSEKSLPERVPHKAEGGRVGGQYPAPFKW